MNKFIILFLALFFFVGCAERKFTISSVPDKSLCEVNGRVIGLTPITVKYVENGTFKIHLTKEGYENLNGSFKLKKKWINVIGLDFIGEVLPYRWSDNQMLEFSLTPLQKISHDTFKNEIDKKANIK